MLVVIALAATPVATPRFANDPALGPAPVVSLPPVQASDFARIETALQRIRRNAAGDPIASAETEAVLAEAVVALPADAPQALERIYWLIHKSFPGTPSNELALLLRDYQHYRQADLGVRSGRSPPADLAAEIEQFKASVALREQYFGTERAERLFGAQQSLSRHLFELRRLDAAGLSEPARQQQRRALQAEYEQRTRAH